MGSINKQHVAIIGAGPSGLLMALALVQHGISSTIYEARGPEYFPSGGVALSPNALRLLDSMGVYQRILPKGFQFEKSDIVTEQGEIVDRHYYGHERIYGYKALRVARDAVQRELTAMLRESSNVSFRFNTRFTGVLSDSDAGVTFEIKPADNSNGTTETAFADLLIGADGIFSAVRRVAIDSSPLIYGGFAGIGTIVPRSEIRYSTPNHPITATIRGKHGAFLLLPEDPDAVTTLAAIQLPYPELSREERESLANDATKLSAILRENYDSWGDMNQSIIDAMCRHTEDLLFWPYYAVPEQANWTTASYRVILVGDSAHAIPPSTGQGVSQAVEDVYSLAYLIAAVNEKGIAFSSAIQFWQQSRKARVAELERLLKVINFKRLPEAERKKKAAEYKEFAAVEKELNDKQSEGDGDGDGEGEYAWLFNADIKGELDSWIAKQTAHKS